LEAEVADNEARIEALEQQMSTGVSIVEEAMTDADKTTSTSKTTTTTQATTTTAKPQVSIGVDDFEVTLIEVENKCFNTAGANLERTTGRPCVSRQMIAMMCPWRRSRASWRTESRSTVRSTNAVFVQRDHRTPPATNSEQRP
jgi:hypothetical protein